VDAPKNLGDLEEIIEKQKLEQKLERETDYQKKSGGSFFLYLLVIFLGWMLFRI